MSKRNKLDALHKGVRANTDTTAQSHDDSTPQFGGYNPIPEDELSFLAEAEERSRNMERAIVPKDDDTFMYKRLRISRVGLAVPDDLNSDEWDDALGVLRKLNEAVQWSIGDLICFAQERAKSDADDWHWGASYEALEERTGYSNKTLREYAYVARSVDLSIRMDKLSFGHHQLVAPLKDGNDKPARKQQAKWLQKALDHGWSIAEMRKQMNAAKQKQQAMADDDWLFGKERIPRVTGKMQVLWSKARNGDAAARDEFVTMVNEMRSWLDEAVDTLDD